MLSRFVSNLTVMLLNGAAVTLSLVLAPGVVTWLGVGVGFGVLAITAIAFLARDRGAVQRSLDCPVAILGGWMIVASRAFSGPPVRWLVFSDALAVVMLTVVGLVVHEALSELALRRGLPDTSVDGDLVLRRRVSLPDAQG